MRTTSENNHTPCPGCQGQRLVTRGTLADGRPRITACYKCHGAGPVLKHDVTDIMATLSARPSCFEAYNISELSDVNRCRLQRIQSAARCKQIETKLENLSHRKVAIGKTTWTEALEMELQNITEMERELEVEHSAQKHVLALPDQELVEFIEELRVMQGAA